MNLEFFIARRLDRPSDGGRPGVMVRIAVVAVAVSLAVMILALAVIMGFKREITRKVVGFMAHVEVADLRSLRSLESQPVRLGGELERIIRSVEGFSSLSPYAVRGAIVRTDAGMQGVMPKGVDGQYAWSFLADHLVEGALPRVGDSIRTKDVLIGRAVAGELALAVGDRVEMLFVEPGEAPRRDRFRVSGIYDSGMEEMDRQVAMTDLRNIQRLSGWAPDEVSGYEVRIADFGRVEEFTRRLGRALLYSESEETRNVAALNVRERYPNIFDWLRAHDVNAAVIIIIMTVVALFNMTSALLILVLERTRMIGLLKAMGMTDRSLQRIFLYRALRIIGRGLVWGNLFGLGLLLVQRTFHLVRLDAAGYLLSEVPVAFGWGWWLALNLGVAAVILLLLTVPAYIVSYIRPDESIRYQ